PLWKLFFIFKFEIRSMKINQPAINTKSEFLVAVLKAYNIPTNQYQIHTIEEGLINQTYLLQDQSGSGNHYILQNINAAVFPHPEYIDHNIQLISQFLHSNYPNQNKLRL